MQQNTALVIPQHPELYAALHPTATDLLNRSGVKSQKRGRKCNSNREKRGTGHSGGRTKKSNRAAHACPSMHAVGPAAMPRHFTLGVEEGRKVWRLAQQLSSTRASTGRIKGSLVQNVLKPCRFASAVEHQPWSISHGASVTEQESWSKTHGPQVCSQPCSKTPEPNLQMRETGVQPFRPTSRQTSMTKTTPVGQQCRFWKSSQ